MNVGSGELLVLSETDTNSNLNSYSDSSYNNMSALLHPLEKSGYSIHVAKPVDCLHAIQKYCPSLVLVSLSSLSDTLDFEALLLSIQSTDNELPVILLAPETIVSNTSVLNTSPAYQEEAVKPQKSDQYKNVIPMKSAQVEALLEQGAEDVVIGSPLSDMTLVIVKNAIEHAIEKRLQKKLKREHSALLERARLLEQDQAIGLQVQQKMLPPTPLTLGGFEFNYCLRPSLIVGGDSLNYFQLDDNRIIFYFADVSGHGVAAALVTASLMGLKQAFIQACHDMDNPADMLAWYNEALLVQGFDQHITMFMGILDTAQGIFQYSNAAHFPSVIYQSESTIKYLDMKGLPLGMCPTKYSYKSMNITDDFSLVMFSDGVLEIMAPKSLVDKESELLSLVQCNNTDVDKLAKTLGIEEPQTIPDDIAIFSIARQKKLR